MSKWCELGINPRKFAKLGNHKQQPWKRPLSEFIEERYQKRFGKACPEKVVTIEERARQLAAKKAARKGRKRRRIRQSRRRQNLAKPPVRDGVKPEEEAMTVDNGQNKKPRRRGQLQTTATQQIQKMIDREKTAWDTKNVALLMSIYHPDMVWPWPPTTKSHDPLDWVIGQGR